MTEEQDLLLLKKISDALLSPSVDDKSSVGKDLQLMAKELTDDRNVFRFTHLKPGDIGTKTMALVMSESKDFPRINGRFQFMSSWIKNESMLMQSVTVKNSQNMADRYKDLGGYLLAFRGGIEWRQAGIMGDQMMDEQQKSILGRLKKG
jgi:hypothetical protein